MMSKRPTVIDLFCGAGGLALGFEQAGFDVLAALDYDPVHAAVHKYNFPLSKALCGDLSSISSEVLESAAHDGARRHGRMRWNGKLDAVVGGPPCQGFSTIGKRLVDDKRNQLVFHFFRVIRDLRPRYFVMENVPGMAAGGHGSILRQLIEEFDAAGYEVAKPARTLNAALYGVPQDRTRLFLLGWSRGERMIQYPDPTVHPVAKRPSENHPSLGLKDPIHRGPSASDAIGDLPDLDEFQELLSTDEVRLTAHELRIMEAQASPYVRRLRGLDPDPRDFSYPREWDRRMLTSSNRTRHTPKSISRFQSTEPGETEPISRFYRIHPDGLCNTIRAGTGSERGAYTSPRPLHPILPRVISVREAARLHSFPDWFRLHRTKWHGFRQIGNSVPPLLGRAVGHQLVRALGLKLSRPERVLSLGDDGLLAYAMSEAAEHFDADPSDIPQPRQRAETA